MNRKMIVYLLGKLLLIEAVLMILPCIVGFIYREETAIYSFIISISLLVLCGVALVAKKPKSKTIYARDGFAVVSLGWILLSLFGALPFFFSGEIPNYLNAVFEAVSGFTTTGASILSEVESLSYSILFWRSFTHWIGGMGVLVFIMAIVPLAGGGGNLHLMRAESPGPDIEKLVPKSNSSARILYGIYLAMTVVEIIFLLCGGMPLFDSLTTAFGTAGTGGFGIKNDSMASYSTYLQIVVTVFMALFGVNFNIYFLLICKRFRSALKSDELRAYLGIMLAVIVVIAIDIRGAFGTFGDAFRASAFQVSSVMTTTGFTTVDFNKWPELSRMLMLMVMCIGASAGSTGGGLKVSRLILLVKLLRKEIRHLAHPRSVSVITFEGKRINSEVLHSTSVYLIVYVMIFVISVILVSFDKTDLISNVSGVIATFNNIGPGLEAAGATGNYGGFNVLSKVVFIADMLLGRLEIFPLILLFSPDLLFKRHKAARMASAE